VVQFRFAGGTYNPDRIHLYPYQTLPLNVREIQKSGDRDVRDKAFPKSATHGQVVWIEETPGSMIGRAELINLPAGVSRSFSCPGACQCPPEPGPGQCQPPGYTGPIGSQPQFIAKYTTQDCQGVSYGPFSASGVTWSSGNTSVASVTPTGPGPQALTHYLSGGATSVTGRFNQTAYGGQGCTQQFPVPSAADCPVRAQIPSSLSASVGNKITHNGDSAGICPGPACISVCYGYERRVTYTVLDQNSPPKTILNANMTATENVHKVSSNPPNAGGDKQLTVTVSAGGTFNDVLAYCTSGPPPPQPGEFIKDKQSLSITLNGTDYPVRVNCLDAESGDIAITDVTGNPGATCQ
jgi:hypothetical protein